jgi:uncharacterized protein (TIGR02001 family)
MGCAWLAVIGSTGAPASAAPSLEGAVVVTSDYVFRGVSQTDGTAAAQADLHVRSDGGWFAGLWTSTVDPPPGDVASYEVDLYAGRSWEVADRWVASVSYIHYMYPNTPARHQYDSDEGSVSARFDDRIALTATYSPNAIRYATGGWSARARMLAYELSLRQPLGGPVALVGGIGYYDTRALFNAAYAAWNLGLSAHASPFDFTLMRFGVNATARNLFGYDAADHRWVVTASWHF